MEKNLIVNEKHSGKFVSPQEMLNLLKKNETNRVWILKQLSQLGIDTQLLQEYSLNQLHKECDKIIRSTYSIKYLGMNQNEMGIISRRIDPFKESNFDLSDLPQSTYTVNKFFFAKPLKVGRKNIKEQHLNIDNLQEEIKSAFTLTEDRKQKFSSKCRKTPAGSWMSASQLKSKEAKSPLATTKAWKMEKMVEFPKQNLPEHFAARSYSRFLNNGLLLVRDRTL